MLFQMVPQSQSSWTAVGLLMNFNAPVGFVNSYIYSSFIEPHTSHELLVSNLPANAPESEHYIANESTTAVLREYTRLTVAPILHDNIDILNRRSLRYLPMDPIHWIDRLWNGGKIELEVTNLTEELWVQVRTAIPFG